MMMVVGISLLFSYLFQGIVSNYVGYLYLDLSWFTSIYILVCLLVLRPYFENEMKYLLLLIVVGFVMGIAYTDAVFLNVMLFVVVYYFAKFFHVVFPNNCMMVNVSTLLGVFIYHIVSYLFLFILDYDHYSIYVLFKILVHSIPMTIVYTTFIYLVIDFCYKRFGLREIK